MGRAGVSYNAHDHMPLAAGTRLGPYEILAPIGKGGMGEVFRARDTKLKRDVALKVLPDTFANDAERMARFQREAEVLASLNHSNIAQIYGIEERAIVMELVEGDPPIRALFKTARRTAVIALPDAVACDTRPASRSRIHRMRAKTSFGPSLPSLPFRSIRKPNQCRVNEARCETRLRRLTLVQTDPGGRGGGPLFPSASWPGNTSNYFLIFPAAWRDE